MLAALDLAFYHHQQYDQVYLRLHCNIDKIVKERALQQKIILRSKTELLSLRNSKSEVWNYFLFILQLRKRS